jgi:hypothetical protein
LESVPLTLLIRSSSPIVLRRWSKLVLASVFRLAASQV